MTQHDPLPSLDKLSERIGKVRHLETPEDQKQEKSDLSMAMRMGVEMVSGVLVGGGVGYLLDKWLGTFPWFFLICFCLGTVAGIRTMYRSAMGSAQSANPKPPEERK